MVIAEERRGVGGGGMRQHELKCLPSYFEQVILGNKRFEIRKNDRDFRVGDFVVLNEWLDSVGFTGRSMAAVITYVTDFPDGLKDGYVCFGMRW